MARLEALGLEALAVVNPTRQTQPYRKSKARHPSAALNAMKLGRGVGGLNPADALRAASKRHKARASRAPRPARPQRPPR